MQCKSVQHAASCQALFKLLEATIFNPHLNVLLSDGTSLQAQLEGGEWVGLLGPGHPGIAEVKWCANRFTPFLCIGPAAAASAGKRDAEEFIEVLVTKATCFVGVCARCMCAKHWPGS